MVFRHLIATPIGVFRQHPQLFYRSELPYNPSNLEYQNLR